MKNTNSSSYRNKESNSNEILKHERLFTAKSDRNQSKGSSGWADKVISQALTNMV
jgi:hypothetical protein